MADFSSITYNGNTYMVKDAQAREAIAALEGGSYFLGVTTTALTDQATTNPITIDNKSVTATNGNVVVYQSKEFIFNGKKWIEFGDLSALGTLAYKNSASGSYKPAGTISKITPAGSVTVTPATTTTTVNSITAVGSLPSLTYDSKNEKLTFNAGSLPTKGSNTTVVTGVTTTGSFTGTEVTPTFTGTQATITVS